ncbi:hypothetical protein C5167_047288 [Papaver somniferum]|uniref:Uncharacterized protein n=1 Tax=Papaver somniferum TaxID=3469 RepID=A0A4Y7LIG7_PAPSO|nr:uncharacterized protein LOC113322821 [Papaver somniferum]RZC84502.1 hypothetical protein C5167_047288 [Papaver somniferum]
MADESRGESRRVPNSSKYVIFRKEFGKDMTFGLNRVGDGFEKAKSQERDVYDQAVDDIDFYIAYIKAELTEFESMYSGLRKDYLSYLNEAERKREGLRFEITVTRNPATDHSLKISNTQLTENPIIRDHDSEFFNEFDTIAFDDQDNPSSTDPTQKTFLSTSHSDLTQNTDISTSHTDLDQENPSTDLTQKALSTSHSVLTQNTGLSTSHTELTVENQNPDQNVENQQPENQRRKKKQSKELVVRTTGAVTRSLKKIVDARTRLEKMAVAAESEAARLVNARSTSKTTRRKSRVRVVPQIQLNENIINQQQNHVNQVQNLLNQQNLQPNQQQNLLNLQDQQQNLEDNDINPDDPPNLEVNVPRFPHQLFDLLNSGPGYIKWFGVASFVVPSIIAFNQQHNPAIIGNWDAIKDQLRNHDFCVHECVEDTARFHRKYFTKFSKAEHLDLIGENQRDGRMNPNDFEEQVEDEAWAKELAEAPGTNFHKMAATLLP